jgi:hypothetical protein
MIAFQLKIVGRLQVEPKPLRVAKESRQTECRVCGDGPLALNDLIDSSRWHTQALGEPILRQTQRIEKLLQEDLTGVNRGQFLLGHERLLMIVHNLNVQSIPLVPPKAHTPLIVDSNAVLPGAVAGEFFQSIPGRCPQVFKGRRSVRDEQLSETSTLNRRAPLSRGLTPEQALSVFTSKAPDHVGIITLHVTSVNVRGA